MHGPRVCVCSKLTPNDTDMNDKDAGPSTRGSQQQQYARQQTSIEDINVFWPRGEKFTKDARYLVGWAYHGGPGELNVVVADVLTEGEVIRANLHQRKDSDDVFASGSNRTTLDEAYDSIRLLGALRAAEDEDVKGKGKQRADDEDDQIILEAAESLSVWLTVSQYRRPRWTSRTSETINIQRIDLNHATSSPSLTILYYTAPHTLEPQHLSSSTATATASSASLTLGQIFESQIASKPQRWFEVTGGFGSHGPGSGLRVAVELFAAVQECRARLRGRDVKKRGRKVQNVCDKPRTVRQYPLIRSFETLAILQTRVRQLRHVLKSDSIDLHTQAILLSLILDTLAGLALYHCLSPSLHNTLQHRIQAYLSQWSITNLTHTLIWLDTWPIGLKLNTELSRFYRDMYSGLISTWSSLLPTFSFPQYPIPLSLYLSLYTDTLLLLTSHIYLLHRIASSQVRALWTLTSFLLDLFRGQKKTITGGAKRIKVAYELDQLLLGTIGFTLAVFLAPTLGSYAALFALAQGFRWGVLALGRGFVRVIVGGDMTAEVHLRVVVAVLQVLYCVSFGILGRPGVPTGIILRWHDFVPHTQATHLVLDTQYKSLAQVLFSSHL